MGQRAGRAAGPGRPADRGGCAARRARRRPADPRRAGRGRPRRPPGRGRRPAHRRGVRHRRARAAAGGAARPALAAPGPVGVAGRARAARGDPGAAPRPARRRRRPGLGRRPAGRARRAGAAATSWTTRSTSRCPPTTRSPAGDGVAVTELRGRRLDQLDHRADLPRLAGAHPARPTAGSRASRTPRRSTPRSSRSSPPASARRVIPRLGPRTGPAGVRFVPLDPTADRGASSRCGARARPPGRRSARRSTRCAAAPRGPVEHRSASRGAVRPA